MSPDALSATLDSLRDALGRNDWLVAHNAITQAQRDHEATNDGRTGPQYVVDLGLRPGIVNPLDAIGIVTVLQLCRSSDKRLMMAKTVAQGSIAEIDEALLKVGLRRGRG